jgi:hypothetical protein
MPAVVVEWIHASTCIATGTRTAREEESPLDCAQPPTTSGSSLPPVRLSSQQKIAVPSLSRRHVSQGIFPSNTTCTSTFCTRRLLAQRLYCRQRLQTAGPRHSGMWTRKNCKPEIARDLRDSTDLEVLTIVNSWNASLTHGW